MKVVLTKEAFEAIRDIDGPDPSAQLTVNVKVLPDATYETEMPQEIIDRFNHLKQNTAFGPIPENETFSETIIRLAGAIKKIFGPKPLTTARALRGELKKEPIIH